MGAECSIQKCSRHGGASRNQPVPADDNYSRVAPGSNQSGAIHMIICALDYKRTSNPLTCTVDGNNIAELASFCNAAVLQTLYDEQATVDNVKESIRQVASKCGPDDYFIFYYSGHGTNLPDQDGDEADHQDEAFCLVDEDGQVSLRTCLRDDDFCDLVTQSIHETTRIIMISDCCHSGTVADFGKAEWEGYKAISISGCTDEQTSGDTGRGGICTHSILLAIEKLQRNGRTDYSVGALYNATLRQDSKVFNSAQDITIRAAPGMSTDEMAWPLVPPSDYVAPMHRAKKHAADSNPSGPDIAHLGEEQLLNLGLSPEMVQFVMQHAIDEDDDDDGFEENEGCSQQ